MSYMFEIEKTESPRERRERMSREVWVRAYFEALTRSLALPEQCADIADGASERFERFDKELCKRGCQ
jgi:heme oxygenase